MIFGIIVLLIGIIALIVAYLLLRKIGAMLSKDKVKSNRVIENVAAGLLATILFIILQKYMESIQDISSIDFESGGVFLKSVGMVLGNLFITTTITFAVAFFAIYIILSPVMNKKK